uniref:Uncharacterized protein n=1 Tax=Arundo donax TaxID=35708 RepID=A0A0A9FQE4_ARUDO
MIAVLKARTRSRGITRRSTSISSSNRAPP